LLVLIKKNFFNFKKNKIYIYILIKRWSCGIHISFDCWETNGYYNTFEWLKIKNSAHTTECQRGITLQLQYILLVVEDRSSVT
jgi:hypothetical protein